jgi:hypothetical protein
MLFRRYAAAAVTVMPRRDAQRRFSPLVYAIKTFSRRFFRVLTPTLCLIFHIFSHFRRR